MMGGAGLGIWEIVRGLGHGWFAGRWPYGNVSFCTILHIR